MWQNLRAATASRNHVQYIVCALLKVFNVHVYVYMYNIHVYMYVHMYTCRARNKISKVCGQNSRT